MDKDAIMSMILDSSSESEESDAEEIVLMELAAMHQKRQCIKDFCEMIVPGYSTLEFKTHFRISPQTFQNIVGRFSLSNFYKDTRKQGGGIQMISAEKHLYCFLWYVGHRAPTYRDIADRFNLSKDSVGNIFKRLNSFFTAIAPEVIIWPGPQKQQAIMEGFQQISGIPNVIGCIDGSHISIEAPHNDPLAYINRKKFHSIQLQVICDNERKIIDAFCGYPGSVHDARVLQNCFIYEDLPNLCRGHYILGDSAYPLKPWCMTPYRDNGHLTRQQRKFNTSHSKTRVRVEHCFGNLKQRFLLLKHIPLRKISTICNFIFSCCVLHNLADENDLEIFEEYEQQDDINAGMEQNHEFRDDIAAADIRNNIMSNL